MNDDKAVFTGKRILVVEDEVLVAMEIAAILESAGCTVVGPAFTVEGALALIGASTPDAVLLDLDLGGGGRGESIANRLLAYSIPFVFVTGYGRDALDEELKGFSLLRKPIVPSKLLASLAANFTPRAGQGRQGAV